MVLRFLNIFYHYIASILLPDLRTWPHWYEIPSHNEGLWSSSCHIARPIRSHAPEQLMKPSPCILQWEQCNLESRPPSLSGMSAFFQGGEEGRGGWRGEICKPLLLLPIPSPKFLLFLALWNILPLASSLPIPRSLSLMHSVFVTFYNTCRLAVVLSCDCWLCNMVYHTSPN